MPVSPEQLVHRWSLGAVPVNPPGRESRVPAREREGTRHSFILSVMCPSCTYAEGTQP